MKLSLSTNRIPCIFFYSVGYLIGIMPYKLKFGLDLEVHFCVPECNTFFFIRIIFYELLFFSVIIPRLTTILTNINILRSVFIVSTISVQTLLMLNYYILISKREEYVKMLNNILNLWRCVSKSKNFTYLFMNQRIYVYEIIFTIMVSTILLLQDLLAHQWQDAISYTLVEIFILQSIFEKINILYLLHTVMKELNLTRKKYFFVNVNSLSKNVCLFKYLFSSFTKINCWFFLNLSFNTFIWVTYNTYKFIIMTIFEFSKFPTKNVKMSFVVSWTWTLLHIFQLVTLIVIFEKIGNEIKNFRFSLLKIFCETRIVRTRRRYTELVR